jgi:hypothetical protein
MARKLGQAEVAAWRRRIEEQARSEPTQEGDCRKHGPSLHACRAWKYREAGDRRVRDAKRRDVAVKFVPLRAAPTEPRAEQRVESVLGEGRVVGLRPDFDEETLIRVVRALSRATC